ncbi:MAG: YggU family protein [bacterium]|nr:YggU family protein [bacterium]
MSASRSPLQQDHEGLLLDIWVVPGASRTEVKGIYDGALRLRVASPPAGGQANRAIVRFLAKSLGCGVDIESGAASRRKRLRIHCDNLATVADALGLSP